MFLKLFKNPTIYIGKKQHRGIEICMFKRVSKEIKATYQ